MKPTIPSAAPIAFLADSLFKAELERKPIKPLTETYPALTLRDAYQVQQHNVDRRVAAGERIVGHKIGLTAKAMQVKFGVTEPDYGHLFEAMLLDGNRLMDLSELIDPQIEVEPAFVLGADLTGPDISIESVLEATEYVCACFEVIDSRIINWQIKLPDTVADNGSSSRLLLGTQRHDPRKLRLDDMDTELELDGRVVETGNTSAILGHPASGIVWLANAVAEYGVTLKAGHIVLPGTCTRSRKIGGLREVKGRIAGLGEVVLKLTGQPTVANSEL